MTSLGQEGASSFAKSSLQDPQGCLHAFWLYNIKSSSRQGLIFPGFPSNASCTRAASSCPVCKAPQILCLQPPHQGTGRAQEKRGRTL